MEKVKLTTKGSTSLYGRFLRMTLLPLIGFGLIVCVFASITYTAGMQNQIEKSLKGTCLTVLTSLDIMYEGDYSLTVNEAEEMFLYKGTNLLSGNSEYIDRIKENTGCEISLFFYNYRLLTTLEDADGTRYMNTAANNRIEKAVLVEKKEHFYNNVKMNGIMYLVYYVPIFGQDGTCIGMIGAARTSDDVNAIVRTNIIRIIGITLLTLLVTALFITHFSKEIVGVIRKMMDFLHEMSKGNLSAELPHSVLHRSDELGEMGRFTVHVQGSLKKLIERDALTGLYNRRSGENKINSIYKKAINSGIQYAVGIGDIDFFKKVNDTYGHEAGDEVLREVAKILNDSLAGKGYVARWGGEEFLLIFENQDEIQAKELMETTLKRIRARKIVSGENIISVTMTYGITNGAVEESVNAELSKADARLYYGKEHGRNQVVIGDDKVENEEEDC